MSIAVECAECGQPYSVRDELAGKRLKCMRCGEPVSVPEQEVDAGRRIK
jgi:DNA-directed RNA polymerase subunit RPC12/RpoP